MTGNPIVVDTIAIDIPSTTAWYTIGLAILLPFLAVTTLLKDSALKGELAALFNCLFSLLFSYMVGSPNLFLSNSNCSFLDHSIILLRFSLCARVSNISNHILNSLCGPPYLMQMGALYVERILPIINCGIVALDLDWWALFQ